MIYPLFPLNSVVCPQGRIPLQLFEPRYVDMLSDCMRSQQGFVILLIKKGKDTDKHAAFYSIGTYVNIVDFYKLPNGLLGITCEGDRKVRVMEHMTNAQGLHTGRVEFLNSEPFQSLPDGSQDLVGLLQRLMQYPAVSNLEMSVDFEDSRHIGWRLTELLPISKHQKQVLLEMTDPGQRLNEIQSLLGELE